MNQAMYSGLKGYTLPLSPHGTSSLVTDPPWYFGGNGAEIQYVTDPLIFKKFLPYPFQMTKEGALVSINMVDMTSVSNISELENSPRDTTYKECLIKLRCHLNGKEGWFVPSVFVDKDFSLLRGFLLGFGKKMGSIDISTENKYNPAIGTYRKGFKVAAMCNTQKINIKSIIELNEQVANITNSNNSLYLIRQFPSSDGGLSVNEIVEVDVDLNKKGEIWTGKGTLELTGFGEEIADLQPNKVVSARIFKEGFRLKGLKKIMELPK